MNNKGFTLVELLAMLVVLAVLMAIVIPNMSGILGNQRLNVIRNDARTMVETAKIKVAKDELIKKPGINKYIVFTLDYLNDNDNIDKGPNGGDYDKYESFVVYAREGNQYKYYVRLIERNDGYNYGIEFSNIDDITEKDSSNIKKINALKTDPEAIPDINTIKNFVKGKRNTLFPDSTIRNYYLKEKHTCTYYQGYYYDNNGNPVKDKATCDSLCPTPCPGR